MDLTASGQTLFRINARNESVVGTGVNVLVYNNDAAVDLDAMAEAFRVALVGIVPDATISYIDKGEVVETALYAP